jgi:hypothetical protein
MYESLLFTGDASFSLKVAEKMYGLFEIDPAEFLH